MPAAAMMVLVPTSTPNTLFPERVDEMRIFRIWFNSKKSDAVCCVLVAAHNSEEALTLAIQQVNCFPELDIENAQVWEFDMSRPHASIC